MTSFYFEGEYEESKIVELGYSRDEKPDKVQANLEGNVTAKQNTPFSYKLLSGSTADGTTILENMKRLKKLRDSLPKEKKKPLLIQHIPPKHFRVVRYYGASATRTKPLLKKVLTQLFRRMKEMAEFTHWRERITSFIGKDPLRSSLCQREIKLVEVAYLSKESGSLAFYHPP